jgi:F-type H+-transporting ATPase subunit gamma
MANLKEVRIRIASVKSTQQITSAMKMVAASKLRKAQNAIVRLRPFAGKLTELLQKLSASLDDDIENVYGQQREPKKVLIIIIASNRGLCGAFNANVIKSAKNLIENTYSQANKAGNLQLVTIGKKVTEYYQRKTIKILGSYDEIYDNLTFENVAPLAESFMKAFADKQFDRIIIVYNQFKNAVVQNLVNEQFLPIAPPAVNPADKGVVLDYIFEPGKEEILNALIPKSLKIQLYKALLDSFASEQGARMTSMQQATDNATDLLKELQLAYNKARQWAITKEILEIVSGAEALKA